MTLPDFYAPRMVPYAKQVEVLERSWRREAYALLMDMGTGKSKVTIDTACLLHYSEGLEGLLVVAPKGVYSNWTRESEEDPGEIQKHLWDSLAESTYVHRWRGGTTQRERREMRGLTDGQSPGIRVLVVNVEALSSGDRAFDACAEFMKHNRSLMVVDESITIMSHTSSRTRAVVALRKRAAWRRILAGRPSKGSPLHLYSQFDFLGEGLLGHRSFYTFRSRYVDMREMWIGGRAIKVEGEPRNLDELNQKLLTHASVIPKEDCVDLPPKIFERREIELTTEQRRVYEDMKNTAMTVLADGSQVTTQIVINQIEKLHQIVCGHVRTDDGGVQRLDSNRPRELLSALEQSDEQVIVWCNYIPDQQHVVRLLREKYGDDQIVAWCGETPERERERGEAEFKAGRARIMVASQSAGGRGRTWTCASLVVYYSNDHDLEKREQSEDRAHRAGQTRSVTYVDLVCPGTIDEKIIASLRKKMSVVEQIMGSTRRAEWI